MRETVTFDIAANEDTENGRVGHVVFAIPEKGVESVLTVTQAKAGEVSTVIFSDDFSWMCAVVEEINKLPPEKRIPVVGIGGICTWQDAVEFIMAGASAVEIGQAKFVNPDVAIDVVNGLKAFMKSHGYHNLEEMRGIAQVKHPTVLGPGNEKQKYAELKNMILSDKPIVSNLKGSNLD